MNQNTSAPDRSPSATDERAVGRAIRKPYRAPSIVELAAAQNTAGGPSSSNVESGRTKNGS